MLRRFGRKEGIQSAIGPCIFYLALSLAIGYSCWPYFYYVKSETLITLGLFTMWRYSWQVTHYIRAIIYHFYTYKKLSKRVKVAAENGVFPAHIFFIIPSYNEEPWVSAETFFSIMAELNAIPSSATLVVSTGSDEDDAIISKVYQAHPARYKVELVLQRQSRGKRIAMGHALRAVARRYNDKQLEDGNSVTVFMDGDSYLETGLFAKTLPIFCMDRKIGAVTTNELAYINTKSQWYKDWFNLKFGQRHILFQSHALSRKVLTLTGRFSIFRSSIVVREDFIRMIENDILAHPLHGKFRFLMGDDKSSWFYLLKNKWDMLYIPDGICYSLESRDARFVELSTSLPYRWYGNTMRNNGRSLALGWRTTGLFIWICILDQRLSMWTSLVGITGATVLSIFRSFVYLPIYVAWILIVRSIQMAVIAFNGHPVSIITIPIMLYNQWVGAVIKIKAFFHLSDQSWSKGKKKQDASGDSIPIPHALAKFMPRFQMIASYAAFIFALLISDQVLTVPDIHALQAAQLTKGPSTSTVVNAADYGVIPNDGLDDSAVINKLIAEASSNTIIQLPPGKIDVQQTITIKRSNITLKGSGREETILQASLKTPAEAVILVAGSFGRRLGQIREDANRGYSVIEFAGNGQHLENGDIILVRQDNDEEFFDEINSQHWRKDSPIIRQSMFEVLDFRNDGLIYLDRSLDIDYQKGKAVVIKPELVRNVSIRDLTIIQSIPGQNIENVQFRYENLFPEYAVDQVKFIWTAFSRIQNVALLQAGKHALVFENSYGNKARNLNVIGAWNKGKQGNGYIRFSRTFKSSLRDSLVKDIRHITLQWSSAYNTFENIHSFVDFNVHGGYSHNNFISNIVFTIPPEHKWQPITRTPNNASWAPPDGPENVFSRIEIKN